MMVDIHTNKVLRFTEAENDDLKSACQRVARLAPQIRFYRSNGFGWPIIARSLDAKGIRLRTQTMKNIISSDDDKTAAPPANTAVANLRGFDPHRPRRNDL